MAEPADPIDDFQVGTYLESVDAICMDAPTLDHPTVVPFRPVHRPPMALLMVQHDGCDDGQTIPIRDDRLVIGRTEGDLLIPHDGMMSARHAEITRVKVEKRWRWTLQDLNSRNGMYVRVLQSVLQVEQEFLLGGRRYRFLGGEPAAFVEVTLGSPGRPFELIEGDNWIGRDGHSCSAVIADDPALSPRHARLFRDENGDWVLANAGSLNGVWVRVPRIAIEGVGQFQLGEQRFVLHVL